MKSLLWNLVANLLPPVLGRAASWLFGIDDAVANVILFFGVCLALALATFLRQADQPGPATSGQALLTPRKTPIYMGIIVALALLAFSATPLRIAASPITADSLRKQVKRSAKVYSPLIAEYRTEMHKVSNQIVFDSLFVRCEVRGVDGVAVKTLYGHSTSRSKTQLSVPLLSATNQPAAFVGRKVRILYSPNRGEKPELPAEIEGLKEARKSKYSSEIVMARFNTTDGYFCLSQRTEVAGAHPEATELFLVETTCLGSGLGTCTIELATSEKCIPVLWKLEIDEDRGLSATPMPDSLLRNRLPSLGEVKSGITQVYKAALTPAEASGLLAVQFVRLASKRPLPPTAGR